VAVTATVATPLFKTPSFTIKVNTYTPATSGTNVGLIKWILLVLRVAELELGRNVMVQV
jgi:hypothetical protein